MSDETDEWPADVVKLGPAAHPFMLQGVDEVVYIIMCLYFC